MLICDPTGRKPRFQEALSTTLHDEKVSTLSRYMDKAYGNRKLLPVLGNEAKVFLFGDLAGGAGYFSGRHLRGCFEKPDEESSSGGVWYCGIREDISW
jgi:hypothetical protein